MNVKKFILIIIIILGVTSLTLSIYALNEKKINTKIKSFESFNINSEITKENVEKNKKIKFNNEEIDVQYEGTRLEKKVYKDNKNNEYILNDNNEIIGFVKKLDLNKEKNNIFTEKEAKKIADNYLKKLVENFNSEYELISSMYIKSYDEFNFVYMNKLQGYKTQDALRININSNGEVASFSAFYVGQFKQYEDMKINTKEITEIVINEVTEKYGDELSNYTLKDPYFKIVDNKLMLQFDFSLYLKDNNNMLSEHILYEIN